MVLLLLKILVKVDNNLPDSGIFLVRAKSIFLVCFLSGSTEEAVVLAVERLGILNSIVRSGTLKKLEIMKIKIKTTQKIYFSPHSCSEEGFFLHSSVESTER